MFRPIRRKKNEISLDDAKALLKSERRGVLAVNGDDGYPYAIPVNFCYDESEGKIYFHGSRVGHKVDALTACDKVCFTVFGNERVKDEDEWAPYVQSVVIFGKCRAMLDKSLAECKLRRLAEKYYPSEDLIDEEIERSGKAVQLYEIDIEHISGKEVKER